MVCVCEGEERKCVCVCEGEERKCVWVCVCVCVCLRMLDCLYACT